MLFSTQTPHSTKTQLVRVEAVPSPNSPEKKGNGGGGKNQAGPLGGTDCGGEMSCLINPLFYTYPFVGKRK